MEPIAASSKTSQRRRSGNKRLNLLRLWKVKNRKEICMTALSQECFIQPADKLWLVLFEYKIHLPFTWNLEMRVNAHFNEGGKVNTFRKCCSIRVQFTIRLPLRTCGQ